MKHYTIGQFTITFSIDDIAVDPNSPFSGTHRLVITYREPAEEKACHAPEN